MCVRVCVCACEKGTVYLVHFRLQPYDSDYEVDVAIKSGDILDVSVSGCSPVSLCVLHSCSFCLSVCLHTDVSCSHLSHCVSFFWTVLHAKRGRVQ